MVPEKLCRLIYCSIADSGYQWSTLRLILEASDRNNSRDQITGVLLFADGMFLQVLEGGRASVTSTFARILQDPRHHSVSLIQFEDADHRDFEGWTMRQLELDTAILEAIGGGQVFDPRLLSGSNCLDLMRSLANNHPERV